MTNPQPDRPEMPESFGVGNPDFPFEPIEWASVVERLTEARNYWICTTRPSGQPHSVPVWGVWAEDAFYFLTDLNSLTAKNLAANPASEVHLESGDEVVMLFGQFEQVELEESILAAFGQKYEMPPIAAGFPVYRLTINKAIAWGESNFPSNASRWRF
ncbi:MAG: pyridoxamine 5'-phosphate oxidase [Chloroflexi bacterium]|nr:pyridoxamine 5'-phosphate oxidase [Chloroflexota bacterium]MYC00470.1 pyridoxamine 5'-phosphate oxidase [Chloroflexota bacterium]